jgi:hypothetical protein
MHRSHPQRTEGQRVAPATPPALGYGRAARIMDELENRGIVGPSNGAEPRDILIDLDVEQPRWKPPARSWRSPQTR